ncbi:hypothetical protein PQR36_35135 [Paraburkholderia nemoris]|uniref:hypothetical protein n=1 Tax=Paraburkholderia nemoris TaxID=2793076 RepID=UPI0038BC9CEE
MKLFEIRAGKLEGGCVAVADARPPLTLDEIKDNWQHGFRATPPCRHGHETDAVRGFGGHRLSQSA